MKKMILLAIATMISTTTFAEVCQVKASGVIDAKTGIWKNINTYRLVKGNQTFSDYTFNDVDLEKAISDRDQLISLNQCEAETTLEKCSLKITLREVGGLGTRIYSEVLIGDKLTMSYGGLADLDSYSVKKAQELIEKLSSSKVCSK